MIAALTILGVCFWVWVFNEVTDDDDDKDTASSDSETASVSSVDGEPTSSILDEIELTEGTEGDDNIFGGEGEDLIVGDEGEDRLFGGEDEDGLFGGVGDDFVRGGADNDLLIGGEGEDTLLGDGGDDVIVGTSLFDSDAFIASLQTAETIDDLVIQTTSGEDTDDGDVINGGNGDDVLQIGSDDTVSGGNGADLLAGGYWIRDGEPAIIEDYDAAEDIITYTYQGDTAPTITTDVDAVTGDATVSADGEEVIVVVNAGPSFNSGNVVLLQET